MKLSEAIRLGSMIRPQAFGNFAKYKFDGKLASCALGAAWEASGHDVLLLPDSDLLIELFPILKIDVTRYAVSGPPVPIATAGQMLNMIVYLNDNQKWTREQIADWVEGVEIAQALQEQRQEEVSV